MKKLLTLVLALAMVFVIAAPAMAAWNAPAAAAGAPYSIKVTAVQENKDAYGHTYYTAFPANAAVVAGTPVLVMVEANIPTQGKLDALYGEQNEATDFGLEFKLTNLTIRNITESLTVGEKPAIDPNLFNDNFEYVGDLKADEDDASIYTAIVSCTVDETKAAKFEAILGYSVAEHFLVEEHLQGFQPLIFSPGYTSIDEHNHPFTIDGFEFDLRTDADHNYYPLAIIFDTETNNLLALTLDEAGKVLTWEIALTSSLTGYRILTDAFVDTVNGTIYTPGMTDAADAAKYAEIAAALKVFTDKFGFKPDDTVYFTEGNILSTFGLNGTVSDYVEFKPYGAPLTVSDTAAVPNTGDSVSVIGFVMVGLALLATAAVVVKKVRA